MKNYFVYILKCFDTTFYTGVTNNLDRRLAEHNFGFDPLCYTAKRRPLELVFFQEFQEIHQAIAFEKQIKGWSRRKN
ncbi:GIY-YIG nuclease family protein [Algoriphagus sp. NG3]|uniref:GIY-YIG nuclease family protein n=1 Tax=Algoriphagus sp. NG3 TaxID=3097546 RepID=UPI002A8016BD|nr:GIY-YIG nuclease family protein [Algoriphagus sp. NG3]WPR74650.1 GIY-YIG nuclease family protein [Algoriphagus sp. NG3]